MTWRELLQLLQIELQHHTLSTFRDEPGAKGVTVTGCPRCHKKFQTIAQLLDHLTKDVLPELIARVSHDK